MHTAIVTGATGFIGKQLCQQLIDQGWSVRATARASSKVEALREIGVDLISCDLTRDELPAEAFSGVTAVFHLAGLTTSSRLDRLRAVNAEGTRRLARSLQRCGHTPAVVHVSSIAASGPAAVGQVRSADDVPAPMSNYGRSKLEGEQIIASIAQDVPVSIVRPSIVFGPGDREGFRIVAPIAKLGIHLSPGWRTPPLSVIHVADLASILIATAERGKRISAAAASQPRGQGIYIAALDQHPTYRQWGELIAEALGRRVRVLRVPPRAAMVVGWCAGQLGSGSLHADKVREGLVPSWAYFDEQLAKELQFQPFAPLTDQLAETVQWYRQQGWLRR